jgi:hypothetical protein
MYPGSLLEQVDLVSFHFLQLDCAMSSLIGIFKFVAYGLSVICVLSQSTAQWWTISDERNALYALPRSDFQQCRKAFSSNVQNYMIFCFTFPFQMFPTFEPHIDFLVSVRSLALHMDREKDRHFSPWEDHNALSSDKFAESLFEYARSPTVSNICTINICNNLCFDESVHF